MVDELDGARKNGSEARLELVARVKMSLEASLAAGGATPQEIADQALDLIDMATVIVDDTGLSHAGSDADGNPIFVLLP